MNLEELKAKALAALDEAIPAHLRSNRHGEGYLGDRYDTIRDSILKLVAVVEAAIRAQRTLDQAATDSESTGELMVWATEMREKSDALGAALAELESA